LSSQVEHKEDAIQWRRSKVLELSSQGQNQRDIAQILRVSVGCINRDLAYLRNQARENIKKYVDERLPEVLSRFNLKEYVTLLQIQGMKERRYKHYH
jgi:transposase